MDLLVSVARFQRRREGRQSEHWQGGCDVWGLKTVDLMLRRWEPLEAVAEFSDVAATVPLPWMLSVMGAEQNVVSKRGLVKVSRQTLAIGTLGLCRCSFVDAFYAAIKYDAHTYLGVLHIMVPSQRSKMGLHRFY
jgi:hypothetical protein